MRGVPPFLLKYIIIRTFALIIMIIVAWLLFVNPLQSQMRKRTALNISLQRIKMEELRIVQNEDSLTGESTAADILDNLSAITQEHPELKTLYIKELNASNKGERYQVIRMSAAFPILMKSLVDIERKGIELLSADFFVETDRNSKSTRLVLELTTRKP